MTVVTGSCLCGSVEFEVELPFERFVNCHCSRCRKSSGSAYAANALVPPDALLWTRGSELVRRYDLPTAASFASAFCQQCGSQLPHLTRNGKKAIIPCGSLNGPVDQQPTAHVHWDSRASWYPSHHLPTE